MASKSVKGSYLDCAIFNRAILNKTCFSDPDVSGAHVGGLNLGMAVVCRTKGTTCCPTINTAAGESGNAAGRP